MKAPLSLVVVVIAVLVVGALGITACGSDTAKPTVTTVAIDGVETVSGSSRNHTTDPVTYPQSPPVGGDHDPVWQTCGVYDAPIDDGNAVHSMEHGAVWLAYRPDLPADQVAVVEAFAADQSHVLVAPYPGLTEAVVATGWGVQLRLDSVTDPRLAAFVEQYQEGPQSPEPGVTCGGGVGEPAG